jgi:hypothetical protein
MHMAHIVREMRGVAPTANGFFFFNSKLMFSASTAHGLSHTPHRKWRFQSTESLSLHLKVLEKRQIVGQVRRIFFFFFLPLAPCFGLCCPVRRAAASLATCYL